MLKPVKAILRQRPFLANAFTWAEPGDAPNANYESVYAKPLAKPERHAPLTREVELELIRAFHEDGDLDALDRLVGAHRPMVVHMARNMWRGNGTSLAALVEYGMLGVRLAAEPPRPSQTKKGQSVGFDISSGNRFSTYARDYARKEMRAALSDYTPVERSIEQENTVEIVAETWHMGGSLRGTLDAPAVVLDLINRKPHHKSYSPWTLWNPTQPQRKPRPRNFIKHPRTKVELENRNAHSSSVLQIYEDVAEPGMEGWDADGKADFAFLLASSHGSRHTLKGKDYRVPMKFMRFWWKLGCKRLGQRLKFSTNQGLGVCNRYGFLQADFSFLAKTGGSRKRKRTGPYLCLKPLASILLVRGRNTARFFPQNERYPPMEHSKWLTRLISAKYFRLGCQWAQSKSWLF
jgi:hypothetical protein